MTSTPTNDPDWRDGDFELVSSDNVRFVVKGFVLFAASPVFADAEAMRAKHPDDDVARGGTNSTRIVFTDPKIETAKVIRMFLVLATEYRIPFDLCSYTLRSVTGLLLFLRKWGCDHMYSLATDRVELALQNDELGPLHVFEMAAILDEVELAVAAVEYSGDYRPDCDVWWDSDYNEHLYPFDARGWSYRFHLEHRIPPTYLAAISNIGWKKERSSFMRRLNLAKWAKQQAEKQAEK